VRRGPKALVAPVGLALLAATGAACGAGASASRTAGTLTVAASVAPIANIVENVVGVRDRVVGLIPEGVDSHTFEPSPETARTLAGAEVIFLNGLHLEDPTLKLARSNSKKGALIVLLGDRTITPAEYAYDFTFPKDKGDPNPHLWMDPRSARRYAEIVRDTMVRRDPRGAATYRANEARFAAVIDRLDPAVAASISSIPPHQRKLLTYHDSFAYFSRRYGIPVLGAVQPTDFSEPSPREVQALVEQVRASHVPAIFGSEVFPSTVLQEVARETGARYVDKLRDDELPGPPSSPAHTYVGLMVEDVTTMTRALGGDPSPLAAIPTSNSYERRAA